MKRKLLSFSDYAIEIIYKIDTLIYKFGEKIL